MGIPGLFGQFISKDAKEAVYGGVPPVVASLAIDFNGMIHDARGTVFGDGDSDPTLQQAIANTDPIQLELELENALATIFLRAIQFTQPRDCLIIAVDGVAPGAKMQQQRGRREKSAKDKSPIETFDRNAITPGTEFMMRLDNFIIRLIGKYRQYLPPKVIYSSHLVPGEGEHKIMDYYRRGEASDGPAAKAGGAHILYGLDADLIMLSLLSPLGNIYLARETVRETLNIDRFKEYLLNRTKKPAAIDDFVVMMFLIGNDFLPHSPALEVMSESINRLLDIYSAGNYVLTQNGEINWEDMKGFLQALSRQEDELLAGASIRQVKFPSRFLQAALIEGQFYSQIFRSVWYQNALGIRGPKLFTDAIFQIIGVDHIDEVTPQRIEQMVVDYFRTMSWTYSYYREGTSSINQDWAYPYYHSPLISDMAAVVQTIGVTRNIAGYKAYFNMVPFTALHQLVAVLPMKSKELIPLELQPLFSYNSILRDLFPDNFIIELDGKNKERDGVPIVPLIDRQRIIEAVAQIAFTPERAKLWLPAEEQFFIRTAEEAEDIERIRLDQQRHQEFLARQTKRGPARTQPTTGQLTQPIPKPPVGRGQRSQPGTTGRRGDTRRAPTQGRGGTTRAPVITAPPIGLGQRGRGATIGRAPVITAPPTGRGTQAIIRPQIGRGATTGAPVIMAPTAGIPGTVRRGPTLVPVGAPALPNLPVGKGRPTLVPIGTTTPTALPVGKGPIRTVPTIPVQPIPNVAATRPVSPNIPVLPTQAPAATRPVSPAVWKTMPTLM